MEIFEKKIQAIEKSTEYKRTSFNIILICNRYLLGYLISNDKEYLNKALNSSIAGLNDNPSNYDLFMLVAFLYIETDDLQKAEALLKKLEPSKAYFKNNNTSVYLRLMFLNTYLLLKNGNKRSINKYKKMFSQEFNDTFPYECYTYLAILEMKRGNFDDAADAFLQSSRGKNNNLHFFMATYKYFSEGHTVFDKNIFYKCLSWMVAQGINIIEILVSNKTYIEENIYENINLYKRIFEEYNQDWILQLICKLFFTQNDKSYEALDFYKKANAKKILTKEQKMFYLEMSYENNIRTFNDVEIIDYLEENKNITLDMRSYIYYLLLSDIKFKNIVEKFKTNIIQLAVYGLERECRNDYYLSIYAYFIIKAKEFTIRDTHVKLAESEVKKSLFDFTIIVKNPDVHSIWIKKNLLKDIEIHSVEANELVIESPSNDFFTVCLNIEKNKVIHSDLEIRRRMPNVNIALLIHFYNNGFRSLNLLVAISDFLIKSRNTSMDVIPILERSLDYIEVSKDFKLKIYIAIGNILYTNGMYEKSLKYYYEVKDNNLNEKYIEPMMLAFINSNDYEKAIDLILSKHNEISDKSLFFAIKEIYKQNQSIDSLANISYNLLIKGWFDKILVELVVKNYKGELRKWMALNKVLADVSNYADIIDDIVLEKSMFLKKIDNDVQKVFIRVYRKNPYEKNATDFIYFITYKILEENLELDLEVLKILEETYSQTEDSILSYALVSAYIYMGVTSDFSRWTTKQAVANMQNEEIVLPCVKDIKDKNIITPYIEKNQPFVHKTLPGRKVFLNYKFNNEIEFKKKPMKYIKFGIYITKLVTFYGDKTTYFISEEIESGNIEAKTQVIINDKIIINNEEKDNYYAINNALINEKLLRYDDVYDIISHELDEDVNIKGRLL